MSGTNPKIMNSRREFLQKICSGAVSIPLLKTSSSWLQNPKRIKKGDMYYRRLGRTGLMVSEISLGGSPLPDWSILLQSIEKGVNYIDTSHSYMNGNSERMIGRLLREAGRDKIHVATKFHLRGNWNRRSIIRSAEGSLKRLGTDVIDVLMIHGAEKPENLTHEEVLSAFETLKQEGKCRCTGLSCHSNHLPVFRKTLDCERYDMIQIGYNVFDIDEGSPQIQTYDNYLETCGLEDLIREAYGKDIGVIAMKTLKVGGRHQNLEKYRTPGASLYQSMLKWALSNRNISSVVTEMLNFQELEEDLAVVHQTLTPAERRSLYRYVAENSSDTCRFCGRCQIQCREGVQISRIFRYLAYHESYQKIGRSRRAYSRLPSHQNASACRSCGQCEPACPYRVPVREKLRRAHAVLAS
ncbi:MAG: aldo/keto reductase [Candidatus Aminicenantes bacterium]